VVGYYVYRGTSPGSYTRVTSSTVASTSYGDSSVTSGQNITYYYVVTAVDGSGVESSDSTPATVTVP
jgi:fibronectin type 3 domain-containing protein